MIESSDISERTSLTAPKPSDEDHAIQLIGGALGCIPGAGSMLQALFSQIIPSPQQKKIEKFNELVLAELAASTDSIDQLRDVLEEKASLEEVVTAVNTIQQTVFTTSDEKKLRYLRNAVVNSFWLDIDQTYQDIFTDSLRRHSAAHMAVLTALCEPKKRGIPLFERGVVITQFTGLSAKKIIEKLEPSLYADQSLYEKIFSDLRFEGLISDVEIDAGIYFPESHRQAFPGGSDCFKTKLGKYYVKFILDSNIQ